VHGEFKLADFGFAKFVKRAEKDAKAPQSYIEGGTEAYGTEPAIDRMFAAEDKLTTLFNLGAPEVARARIKKTKTEVKQTIDTWSFGCVLSAAATWIVLGFQGIEQFRVLRMLAAQGYGGTVTDRFHDGDSVLPDIKHWHNYLTQHARPGDTITPLVLELIESGMLLKDPDCRLSSSDLCEKLEQVLRHAEADRSSKTRGKKETHDSVKRALLTVERVAPLPGKVSQAKSNPQRKIVELQDVTDGNVSNQNNRRILFNPSIRASNRVGKDKKMNIPFAKTPYREKILEEELENRVLVSAVLRKDEGPSNLHNGASTDSPTNIDSSLLVDEASGERAEPQPQILLNDDRGWGLPALEPEFEGEPATPSKAKLPKIKEPTPPRTTTRPSGDDTWPQNQESPTVTDVTQPPIPTETTWKQNGEGKAKVEGGGEEKGEEQKEEEQKEEKQKEEEEVDPGYKTPPMVSPEHVFELPWEICQVRRDIETKIPQGLRAKFKDYFKKEPKDEHLEAFIQKRDLVLVIDNGTSMQKFWPIVTFVAITLAMKIAGLDEDGYDVRFTINGAKYDEFGLKGKGGLETLKKTLMAAQPQPLKPTDMSEVLDDLFREHQSNRYRKATTLLVLTDGAWEGTIPVDNADNKIVEFARDLGKVKARDRHYTIGFIRFGVEFRDRLKALDDELSEKHEIR
jgi:serine/threonine protein kinase